MRYSSILFIQCFAILVMYAAAAPQVLIFTVNYEDSDPSKKATFTIDISPNDATIDTIQIIDATTGNAGCSFTENNGYQQVPDVVETKLVFTIVIDPTPNTLTNPASAETGCPFESGTDDGYYTFYVRAINSGANDPNDREYTIVVSGAPRTNVRVEGSDSYIGPQIPTLTSLSPATPTVTFEVVDGNTFASVTTVPLGSPIRLKLTIVVDPYIPALDIAAGGLYSCDADETGAFDSSKINIIGSDGCWNENELFENMYTNRGANKHDPSSTLINSELTFVAMTDKMEMAVFNDASTTSVLHFNCYLKYCGSADTSTCDDSCDPARKKRSILNPDLTLRASVNFTSNDGEVCEKCVESTTFAASTASIGALAAIVCGFMSCTFIRARQIGKSPYCKGNRSAVDHFHVPSSTQSLKSGASPSRSSSAGSVRKF